MGRSSERVAGVCKRYPTMICANLLFFEGTSTQSFGLVHVFRIQFMLCLHTALAMAASNGQLNERKPIC